MKKNLVKVCAFLLLALVCFAMVTSVVNASGDTWTLDQAKQPNQYANASDNTGAAKLVNGWLGSALVVVQVVGVGVAVIMLIVLAIKYISAAPSDKAEIKKHAVVYVVGAIVLFAASGILGLIRRFANTANDALNG